MNTLKASAYERLVGKWFTNKFKGGAVYEVLLVGNQTSDRDDFPLQIVYRNIETLEIWVRSYAEFKERMEEVPTSGVGVVESLVEKGLKTHIAMQDGVITSLRKELDDCYTVMKKDYWVWQGDGTDDLGSLTCKVVIEPEVLLALTTPGSGKEIKE